LGDCPTEKQVTWGKRKKVEENWGGGRGEVQNEKGSSKSQKCPLCPTLNKDRAKGTSHGSEGNRDGK